MPHRILLFSGGCELCNDAVRTIEIGKCKDCKLEILNINQKENREKAKEYGITSVPTIIIDEKIKFVGNPLFPWFCGEEFYYELARKYPYLREPSI
jgi:glutaredoxin